MPFCTAYVRFDPKQTCPYVALGDCVMNLIRNVFAASAVLLAVAVSAPASSNAAVYNFLQNACDASLGCNGSSALVATATTVDVTGLFGFGVQVTIHRVDSNFDFYQAGQPPVTMTGWHASADPTAVIPPTQLTIGGEAVIWGAQLAPYPDFNPGSSRVGWDHDWRARI